MSEPRQWFVLLHQPGPEVPAGTSVFDHPGIADHYAFLQRRRDDGSLVAAGPLVDTDGEGMTILATDSEQTAWRLAEQDDQSVRDGVLKVTVRPWQVVMAPVADYGA
jgi:uncharacterized protein